MSLEAALALLADMSRSQAEYTLTSVLRWPLFVVLPLLLCVPLLRVFFYWTILYPYFLSPLRHLPGPKDDFYLLGQTYKFLSTPWLPHLFLQWSRAHPHSPFIRYLGVGNAETLIASTMSAYKEVLQTKNNCFVKPELTRLTAGIVIGSGLPFSEGHLHRHRKAALSKPFSISRIKFFVPVVQAKARRLVHVLARNCNPTGEVEVESHLWKTVLDIIGSETLSLDLNHLESQQSPLHRLFCKTMQQSTLSHIIHYFNSYLPLRSLIPIRVNSDFLDSCAKIRTYLRNHVIARRLAWQSQKIQSEAEPDALQCMVDTGYTLWSDEEIVEHVLNLMVLGHDTTACSLVWAVHALARYPDMQELLRTEFSSILRTVKEPEYADIERLPYVDNFLREVLRVYCPVAFVPRQATCDVEIAGVVLPKGTVIYLSPAVMNMNPTVWGPSANEFDPDRWRDLKGDAANVYAFESFHHGPRMCLGKQLSLMEMKVILMELVSEYRVISLDGSTPVEFASPSFTLRPKAKLHVRLVKV